MLQILLLHPSLFERFVKNLVILRDFGYSRAQSHEPPSTYLPFRSEKSRDRPRDALHGTIPPVDPVSWSQATAHVADQREMRRFHGCVVCAFALVLLAFDDPGGVVPVARATCVFLFFPDAERGSDALAGRLIGYRLCHSFVGRSGFHASAPAYLKLLKNPRLGFPAQM